jgi:hypothetical protein
MVLAKFLLSPLGLAAALAALPVIVLYPVRPEPVRLDLPTYRFLTEANRLDARRPLL